MGHAERFLAAVAAVAQAIDPGRVEALAAALAGLRARGGRLFLVGVGGSAANCSHAVNDFRKLCGIEAYTPVDNVAELTARINDEGWEGAFADWLAVSRAGPDDALMVFSVGGGDAARNISPNIVRAVDEARRRGLAVWGIVGRADGHTAAVGDLVLVVPAADAAHLTPLAEAFQAVLWHCLVCHPDLQARGAKWETALAAGAAAGAVP